MPGHCVAEILEFPIDASLTKRRFESERIKEDVDVFRKSLNEVPAL